MRFCKIFAGDVSFACQSIFTCQGGPFIHAVVQHKLNETVTSDVEVENL